MDETEHWRLRLVELKDALGETQAAMASAMGVDASYFSRLLYPQGKKGRKNLGLDTLRSLCKAYQLRVDWFDLPLGSMLPSPGDKIPTAARADDLAIARQIAEPRGEPARAPIAWPFKDVAYQRIVALQATLGPKHAGEAMRDLDSLLDIAVARWEHRAAQLSKHTG